MTVRDPCDTRISLVCLQTSRACEAFKANNNMPPKGKGYKKSHRKIKALQQKKWEEDKKKDKEENMVDAGEEPENEEEVHIDICIRSTSTGKRTQIQAYAFSAESQDKMVDFFGQNDCFL